MRLCWADKIPLALFALITLFMLVLGAGANPDNSQYCTVNSRRKVCRLSCLRRTLFHPSRASLIEIKRLTWHPAQLHASLKAPLV
jgi:hypothetical protein